MKTRIVSILVLVVLLMHGVIFAQEDLTESYTVLNGSYTFNYPAEWRVEELQNVVVISDAEPIFDIFNAQLEEFPSENLNLMMAPASVLNLDSLEPENRTAAGIVRYTANDWFVFDENIETLEVNGVPAARLIDSTEDRALDTLVMVVDYENDPFIILAQSGLNALEPYLSTVSAIIETISLNGEASSNNPTANADLELEAISLDTIEQMRSIVQTSGEDNDFYDGAFSPSSELLALSNHSDSVQIVSVVSGEVVNEFDAMGEYVVFPDETHVLTLDQESGLSIYDVNSGDLVDSLPIQNAIGFHFEGDQLQGVVGVQADNEWGFTLGVIDVVTGEAIVPDTFDGFEKMESYMAFGGNRVALAFSTTLFVAELPDLALESPLVTIDTSDSANEYNTYEAVALSPDGSMVVVTTENHEIAAYDAETGDQLYTIDRSESGSNLSWATFSPDGSVLFVSERETLLVIDAMTGELLRSMPSSIPGNFEVLKVSPDGHYLVGAAYEALNIWAVPSE